MTTTTNLLITHIESSQAQKEVTANEAFDRLDTAIAGRLALSTTGGTTTLTDAQASNAILDVSGALTSNAVIVVPARSKLYAVRNATSGAFTLTVKTASGTGVIVAQGYSAVLFCDGVNVSAATDAQMADHLAASDPHPQYATDADLSAHTGAASGAHAASAISNVAAGNIAATTVQDAINELDSEKAGLSLANTFTQPQTIPDATAAGHAVNKGQFDLAPQLSDFVADRVVSGLTLPTSTTLSSTIAAGVAWVLGQRVVTAATALTFAASSDTYVDLSQSGTFTLVAVANGAAEPAKTTNTVRLFKVVTDATAITVVSTVLRTTLRTTPQEVVEIGDANARIKRTPDGPTQIEATQASLISAGLVQSQQTANALWDGTNWNRIDTAQPASRVVVDRSGTLNLYTAASGANPITWSGPYPVIRGGMSYTDVKMSANQSIAAATYTKVAFDTVNSDIRSNYDSANYRFVVPEGGVYDISAAVIFLQVPDGARSLIEIYRNGARFRRGSDKATGALSDLSNTVGTTARLATTDYIEVYAYCSAAVSLASTAGLSWFSVSRVQ